MFPIFLLIVIVITITQFYVSGCLFSKIACRKSFGTLVHWYTGHCLDTGKGEQGKRYTRRGQGTTKRRTHFIIEPFRCIIIIRIVDQGCKMSNVLLEITTNLAFHIKGYFWAMNAENLSYMWLVLSIPSKSVSSGSLNSAVFLDVPPSFKPRKCCCQDLHTFKQSLPIGSLLQKVLGRIHGWKTELHISC